jgi:hypothetical protein
VYCHLKPMSTRFGPYRDALNAVSIRTRTPLPSLLVSFAVLHELTAIIPLVGIFFGARSLGVGERLVRTVTEDSTSPEDSGWIRERCRTLVGDGERWAKRVGTKYGIFGFHKDIGQLANVYNAQESSTYGSGRIVGDVANAVVAYGVTKVSFSLCLLNTILNPSLLTARQ